MDTKFPKWALNNKNVMSAVEIDSDYALRVLETGKYTSTNAHIISGLKREAYKMLRSGRLDEAAKQEFALPDSDA